MPLLKKPSKKMPDSDMPEGKDLALAVNVQRQARKKKMAKGGEVSAASGKADADNAADSRDEHLLSSQPSLAGELKAAMERPSADKDNSSRHMHREPSSDPKKIDAHHMDDIEDAILMAAGGSVAEKIMRKRMASGGQVDLQANEDEQPELFSDLNEDAVKKEYYDLGQLDDQPLDSIGHELSDEDSHDHIERIRARMRSRRGY